MATEGIVYLGYPEAVALHLTLMRRLGESRFGVAEAELIHSALARPRHAAHYEKADLIRQAATLCFGLIKNHPPSTYGRAGINAPRHYWSTNSSPAMAS